jgi:hypothetical protein
MQRIPLFNGAEDIIQAFELGRHAKQEGEQLQLRKEQDARDFEEGKKVNTERQKLAQEELKQRQDEIQRRAKEAQAQHSLNVVRELNDLKRDYNMYGGPKQVVRSNWAEENASEIQQNIDHQPFINSSDPELQKIIVKANEYREVPYTAQARMDALEQARLLAEEGRQSKEGIARDNRLSMEQRAAEANDLRKYLGDQSNATRQMIASLNGQSGQSQVIGQDDAVDNDFLTGARSMEDLTALVPAKGRLQALSALKNKEITPLSKKHIEAIDAVEEASSIIDDIASLKKLVSPTASINPFSDYSRKKEFIRARIGKLRDSLGGKALGVLSNYDLARLEGALPNSYDVFAKTVDQKIMGLKKLHNDSADRLLKNMSEKQRAYYETQRRLHVQ